MWELTAINFPCSPCIVTFIICTNQSFQKLTLIFMQFSIGKKVKKKLIRNSVTISENRISVLKPKTGFPVFD